MTSHLTQLSDRPLSRSLRLLLPSNRKENWEIKMLNVKRILMVGASVLALGVGSAMAANVSNVNQPGGGNTATVGQGATGNNLSDIQQAAENGTATVDQVGGTNTSNINQVAPGDGFSATVDQSGDGSNLSSIYQKDATAKTATVTQISTSGDQNKAVR